MKKWLPVFLGLLVLGGIVLSQRNPAMPASVFVHPSPQAVPSGSQPPPPATIPTPTADAVDALARDQEAEKLRAAQTYFAGHIDRLKQIAFTDYPQALANRRALSARCDAVKRFGRDYRERFKREHEKIERDLNRRIGDDYEDGKGDAAMVVVVGRVRFLADCLQDHTVVVEGTTVSDMLRELAESSEGAEVIGHIVAEIERKILHDPDAARRAERAQPGAELVAFLEGERTRLQTQIQTLADAAGLSPEEAEFLVGSGASSFMQDIAHAYQDLPDWMHKKLFAEYEKTAREMRGLLDQTEDGPEKRTMLTELADLYAQMRRLGKG